MKQRDKRQRYRKQKEKSKRIMEITPTSIWVEHPEDYDFEKLPVETIQLDNLVGFEPDEKMEQEMSSRAVIELSEKIKNWTYDAPPIMVRKYKNWFQVVDGHHRFHAHKLARSKTINAKVIPQEDIDYRDHRIQSANRL